MIAYPDIDPVFFKLGSLELHWYGLMYLLGFAAAWLLGRYRAGRPGAGRDFTATDVDDLIWYLVVGLVIGARVGYVLFYEPSMVVSDPLGLVALWRGGMSFHGGLLGVCAAVWLFARKKGVGFFRVTDFVCPLAPIGLFLGRIGNFINAELWGRPTDVPWAMVFPAYGAGLVPRHPSQLYEALLEGVVLFVVLWLYSRRQRPEMAVSGLFALLYGVFRFLVEFTRQPDAQLGFVALGWMTMGQLLSIPLICIGALLLHLSGRRG